MNSRTLNGLAFGMTIGMIALLATVVLDISQAIEWMVVWPVVLLAGSAAYIIYNIARDLSMTGWDIKNIEIETKIDIGMLAFVVVFIVIMLII